LLHPVPLPGSSWFRLFLIFLPRGVRGRGVGLCWVPQGSPAYFCIFLHILFEPAAFFDGFGFGSEPISTHTRFSPTFSVLNAPNRTCMSFRSKALSFIFHIDH
jgi:hypothetical protein